MKILNLDQGTDEWKSFRLKHITATDSATILGLNPYMSANILWEEKMGLRLPKELNAAMARGIRMEEPAKKEFEHQTGLKMDSIVILCEKHDFAMASLDGYEFNHDIVLEIKAPGRKNFEKYKEMSLKGEIDTCHYAQVQHQMMCADNFLCFYFCYQNYENFTVKIKRDDEFIEKMLIEEKKFYDCMINFERPT